MNPTRDLPSWRVLAIGSFVLLVTVVLAWNGAAWAIDSSGLEPGSDSWGLLFGSAIVTVIYGSAPLAVSLIAAVVGGLGTPELAQVLAWCNAGIAAIGGAALLLAAGILVGGPAAEVAFSLVSLLLALVLVAPVVLCVRRARSDRS